MEIIHHLDAWRQFRRGLGDMAYVPTMGNLHRGHLTLVRDAQKDGLPVVASIFVNPLQFLPHEDFHAYPRTLEDDCRALAEAGCRAVFAPSVAEIYPEGKEAQTFRVNPPANLADILEGEFRPGFFMGVCTVVLKFLHLVQPQTLWLGKKDYQQWRVLAEMIKQLNLPIEVFAGATVREPDGLALSSRNGYLSSRERQQAIELSQTLQSVASTLTSQPTLTALAMTQMAEAAMARLTALGWQTDYITVRHAETLHPPEHPQPPLVVLGAAKLGKTRLIDNVEVTFND